LTVVLLMGAALLANSFVRMTRVDVGFDPRNLATVRLQLPDRYRSRETQDALFETLIARVRTLPGVRAVTTGTDMPPAEGGGIAISANGVEARTTNTLVDAGYFKTLGIPVLEGRAFDERDGASAPAVII